MRTARAIEYVEEWSSDRSIEDFEDNGNHYDNDNDDDSDFWRRVGDFLTKGP
jgi:hypothetical protein